MTDLSVVDLAHLNLPCRAELVSDSPSVVTTSSLGAAATGDNCGGDDNVPVKNNDIFMTRRVYV